MLRWTIRILLVFVVLIVVAVGIVHVVLRSDRLAELILTTVSERIGMEVTSESLSVGWSGRTTLRGPAVKMPLTDEVVLAADRIEIAHTAIPLLIFGRPVHVRSVRADSPKVSVRQYASGRWNVQDVWTRLAASFEFSGRKNRPTALPRVMLVDAMVQITEPNAAVRTVGPLDFRADPQGVLLWRFDLSVPQLVEAKGRVVQGSDWTHDVRFVVGDTESLVRRILGGDLSPIQIEGRWEGRVLQDAVSGMLRLDRLAVGPVTACGGVLLEVKAGGISIRPQGLAFSEPNLAGHEVHLANGSVQITGREVCVEQLSLASSHLAARIDGRWDWIAQAGEFVASWAAASDEKSPQYSGTCRASVKSPQAGRKAARVSMTADVETSSGDWAVAADVEGAGADWRQSQWRLSTPTFVWSRDGKQVDLAGATAEIRMAWPAIQLTSLHLPNTRVTNAAARFDPNTRRWSARLAMENLGQLEPWGVKALDFLLDVEGDDHLAHILELRLTQGARTATATGNLSFHEKGFQDVRLTADWPGGHSADGLPEAGQSVGHWHLEGDVFGRVRPLAIEMTGRMTGRNITLGKQTVDRVEIPVRAKADTREIQVATDAVGLLGGRWLVNGCRDLSSDMTQLAVTVDDLLLESVVKMVGLPFASGGRTRAQIRLAMEGFDIDSAVADGSWDAEDVNVPPLRARKAHGKFHFSNGQARLDQIELEQEGGRIQASVEFRLDDPRCVHVEMSSNEWKAKLDGYPLSFYTDGKAKLRVNVVERTADGVADLSGRMLWGEREFGRVRTSTLVRGQTLDIRELHADALGGSVEGQAVIPLNHWKKSTARLDWQGLQPRQLQQWAPQFEQFEGTVSGSLQVEQAGRAERPPEPMRFVVQADAEDGRFGPAQVDSCRIVGFLGDRRLLIDEATLRILGGQVKARTRVSAHPGGHYGSLVLDFNDLRLNQLVHLIVPDASEYAGNLSGSGTVLTSANWHSFGGEARINLTQSDLVGNRVVRVLHNTLNLQSGKQEPTGIGELSVQLEGPSVVIPSFRYFNQGVEIRGAGRIVDVNRGARSPVDGFAVASTRILKGVRLPGVKALDQLLATVQTGAASVEIGGTLEEVDARAVPLPDVLGSFRRLLWAQLRE